MPSRSARSKNSRVLLLVVVVGLGWAAWRLVTGGGGGPDPEQLAFRPLPYVNYGLKPSFTRRSERVLFGAPQHRERRRASDTRETQSATRATL